MPAPPAPPPLVSSPLERLFNPRSIAIVGASSNPDSIAGRPLAMLRSREYSGSVFPVNPRRRDLGGLRAYATLADLPEIPDVAMIMVGADQAVGQVGAAAAIGVPFVAVYSSGFNETATGAVLAHDLADALHGTQTRLLGPNCQGLVDFRVGTPLGFSPVIDIEKGAIWPEAGRVVAIFQSGGLGFAFMDQAKGRDITMRAVVSTGNELDLEISDFVDHFANDGEVAVITLFLEGLRDARRFMNACARAKERGIEIVAVKAGRSRAGTSAAASHTGKIAGRAAAYDAVLVHAGARQAHGFSELLDIVAALERGRSVVGRRAAILTTSGGAGVWTADTAEAAGLEVNRFSPQLSTELAGQLPAFAYVGNPVDVTAQALFDRSLAPVVAAILDSPEVDGVILVGTFGYDRSLTKDQDVVRVLRERRKPLVVFSYSVPDAFNRRVFGDVAVPWYSTPEGASRGLASLLSPIFAATPPVLPQDLTPPRGGPVEVRRFLSENGIAANPIEVVHSASDTARVVEASGFPVVMKVVTEADEHKTELGGVVLNIRSSTEAEAAFATLHRLPAGVQPSNGVSIERQLYGQEVIVGAINDPLAGPLIMVGSGGVLVEILSDAQFRLAPLDPAAARTWLSTLPVVRRISSGFRSHPPVDVEPLIELVVRFSQAVARLKGQNWSEIELNPVIVGREGATAVDVRVVGAEVSQ